MQSIWARVVVLAALAAAVALFVVLSGAEDEDSDAETETASEQTATGAQTPPVPVVQVRNGEPLGGVERIEVKKGDQVRLDVLLRPPEEEIHVHGYEITESAAKGRVPLRFRADLDGIFEIEVHGADGSEVQVAELRVTP
ncbi:MAG: hypothetical protein ACRDL6_08470 [Solirubrobacterales bacterium]